MEMDPEFHCTKRKKYSPAPRIPVSVGVGDTWAPSRPFASLKGKYRGGKKGIAKMWEKKKKCAKEVTLPFERAFGVFPISKYRAGRVRGVGKKAEKGGWDQQL